MSLRVVLHRQKGAVALDGSLLRLEHVIRLFLAVGTFLGLSLALVRQVANGELFGRWALNFSR